MVTYKDWHVQYLNRTQFLFLLKVYFVLYITKIQKNSRTRFAFVSFVVKKEFRLNQIYSKVYQNLYA